MTTPAAPSIQGAADAAQAESPRAMKVELAATLTDLAAVLAIVHRAGGYLAPEDQLALRAAKARLVAAGRSAEG
jgi:hypothetical protein